VRALHRTELALIAGILVALVVAGAAAAWTVARRGPDDGTLRIELRYSRFEPAELRVPVGVPVTVELHNGDPIDHEWILGDDGVHERHRTGTEPVHDARPTEVTIPAGATVRTTITLDERATLRYVCHLPGHEAYGMTGILLAGG
jgi:uncharacterized cupredoxin-like copper-binding protein